MPKLSRTYASRLATCHPLLRRLFERVSLSYATVILQGHVGRQAQERAVAEGRSAIAFPHGPHNRYPSMAVDVVPYGVDLEKIDMAALERIFHYAGFVKGVAEFMAIKVRWAGEKWDPSKPPADLVHFELGYDVEPEPEPD